MKASIRDLRYGFGKIEELLQSGEEILITRRKRVIARLLPPSKPAKKARKPDFLARLERIYGNQRLSVSGADILRSERDRY